MCHCATVKELPPIIGPNQPRVAVSAVSTDCVRRVEGVLWPSRTADAVLRGRCRLRVAWSGSDEAMHRCRHCCYTLGGSGLQSPALDCLPATRLLGIQMIVEDSGFRVLSLSRCLLLLQDDAAGSSLVSPCRGFRLATAAFLLSRCRTRSGIRACSHSLSWKCSASRW
jgi:hypothetical protein